MRTDKRASSHKADKKNSAARHRQGVVGYSKKSALLEEAITHMNAGKYGRSSAALKELLALDPQNIEARRLFATLHLRLGSLVTAREAFEALANEAIGRQDYWLAESLLREYLAAGPRCIPFLELLAHVYEEKGDAMAAVGELGKAIEILIEDPDPDNPKKPSQFYAKIRELAPASPVAFQFASLFDFQTGEFRLPQKPLPDHGADAKTSLQGGALSSDTGTLPPADIMPWEHVDELPTAPAPANASVELEFEGTDTNCFGGSLDSLSLSEQARSDSMPPGESFPENESGPEHLIITAVSGIPVFEIAPATQIPPFAVEESIEAVSEPSFENVTRHEALVDPTPEISTASNASGESSPVLSRMPWEHVADPALQIVEPEPTIKSEPPAETFASTPSILLCEPEVSMPLSPPAVIPVNVEISSDTTTAAVPEERGAEPVQTDAQHVEHSEANATPEPIESISEPLPASPSPDASSPASFSWKEIFDSAWKFTVGTTAPSASMPVKDPEPTTAQELNQPFESSHGPETAENFAGSSPQTDTFSTSVLSPSVSDQDQQTEQIAVEDMSAISSEAVEPSAVLKPGRTERECSVPTAAETYLATSESEYVPPAPPSFSLVVEEQIIPTPALEPAAAKLPSTAPPTSGTIPDTVEQAMSIPQPSATQEPSQSATGSGPISDAASPAQFSSPQSSHWNTGEVAVQSHRPSKKKHQWDKEPAEIPAETAGASTPMSVSGEERASSLSTRWASTGDTSATIAVPEETPAPNDTRPEWEKATDSILLDQGAATDATPTPVWEETSADSFYKIAEPSSSPAATAVDVLFGGHGETIKTTERFTISKPRPRIAARLARLRQAVTSLILSGFSTTQAFVVMCISLVVLLAVAAAAGVGIVALIWIVLEEPATQRYQSLTTAPQRQMIDSRKNGFFLLMGFDASASQDAVQAGYERKPTDADVLAAKVCMEGYGGKGAGGMSASFTVIDRWFKDTDPLAQLKAQSGTMKSVLAQQPTSLGRYQQWLSMPFEDWGFGQMLSPDCPRILFAHRLYLLEGLTQDTATAVGRLEKDMEAWRIALSQSKTLMMKMLAATAVQDNTLLASGLLMRPDTDTNTINRLSKVVRPLDQVELSVRWPMQSHFVWATRNVNTELKKDRTEERPIHVSLAAAMPLPVQRRANAYAEYYDAANRAFAEGRYANLPKPAQFMRPSASSVIDYLANPIEHVIGIDPLPSWDPYAGRMVEIDAQLRLASLQAWVRRGPQDGDVLARLAKAGQAYYDPFTGLPMLVNQQKRLLYSVGRDGKDQEGDPRLDVVVAIPSSAQQPSSLEAKHLSK